MPETVMFLATEEDDGDRLDVVFARRVEGMTRSTARMEIEAGHVTLNRHGAKPATRLNFGDRVEGRVYEPMPSTTQPQDIPLVVIYRDDDMAVIEKPAGLVVHPAAGHEDGTLANALSYLFPTSRDVGDRDRPGIVHRLDKDTSGLMMVALSRRGLASLQAQIASREAGRQYLALASGQVHPDTARIEAPIGRDPTDRKRMAAYGAAARPAQTTYQVKERFAEFTYLVARLHTGRTHQIRVHFAAIGHPLAGDRVYSGPPVPLLERQFLHAYRLNLRLPSTNEAIEFTSPLPPDLAAILAALRDRV